MAIVIDDFESGEGGDHGREYESIRELEAREAIARYRAEGKGEIYDRAVEDIHRNDMAAKRRHIAFASAGVTLVFAGLASAGYGVAELGIAGLRALGQEQGQEVSAKIHSNLVHGGIALPLGAVLFGAGLFTSRFGIDWAYCRRDVNYSRILREAREQGVDARYAFSSE